MPDIWRRAVMEDTMEAKEQFFLAAIPKYPTCPDCGCSLRLGASSHLDHVPPWTFGAIKAAFKVLNPPPWSDEDMRLFRDFHKRRARYELRCAGCNLKRGRWHAEKIQDQVGTLAR